MARPGQPPQKAAQATICDRQSRQRSYSPDPPAGDQAGAAAATN